MRKDPQPTVDDLRRDERFCLRQAEHCQLDISRAAFQSLAKNYHDAAEILDRQSTSASGSTSSPLTSSIQRTRKRRVLALLALHVVICCLSLVYIETFYGYDIIPEITSAGIYEAISIAAGFAVAGILILRRARFSFGYFVGFYFFTMILGYLWIAPLSRLPYNHEVSAASAFVAGLAFLVPQLFYFRVGRRVLLSESALRYLLLAIPIAAGVIISIGTFYNFKLVGLSEIYEFRDKANFPLLLRYAIGITSSALLPFAFACFVERRQTWLAGTCLVLLFAFYPLTLAKLSAFAPFWLVFLAILSSYVEARLAVIVSLLLPAVVGLLSVPMFGNSIFGITNFRMLAIPSIAMDVYGHFFADHPLTYFCQVHFSKSFVNCAYSEPLDALMDDAYHFGRFNASLFSTEGIASVGPIVSPLVALSAGMLISFVSFKSFYLPPRFIILSGGILVQVLLNVPLTTTMLTYGAGFLFLLWYVTPRSALAPHDAAPLCLATTRLSSFRSRPINGE
jgi:hypothetical protein